MTRAQQLEEELRWFEQWRAEELDSAETQTYLPSNTEPAYLWNCGGI